MSEPHSGSLPLGNEHTSVEAAAKHEKEKLWLSVITVVKDAPLDLLNTYTSLQGQSLAGVEWVVVDGSAQTTWGIDSDQQDFAFVYRRQKPIGVFHAMNLGISIASGRYLYFLNAGDVFASHDTLESVRHSLAANSWPAWAYGDVAMTHDTGAMFVPPTWDHERERSHLFARGHFPPHQGTLVRASVIRSLGGFDPTYSVGGDYDLFLRLDQLYEPLRLPITVARFAPGGHSSKNWWKGLREFHRSRRLRLEPKGRARLTELFDTLWLAGKTTSYQLLWAPGRPLHHLIRHTK